MVDAFKGNGGQAVVACLAAERVEYVFGIPGGQNLAIMDALYDCGVSEDGAPRFITAHDERSAACMADGYARATGRPGVCLVTTGPGMTNLLTGVGGAFRDSSPVVLLTANNRGRDLGRDDAQEADHVELLRGLTKWSLLVTDVERIPEAMREAFRRALTGCPGPVHVDFTREILEDATVEFRGVAPERYRHSGRVRGDPEAIETAARLLMEAQRPVLWSGNGVLLSEATDAVVRLAETLDAPMVTTYNGIGGVPADHALAFGAKSRHGTEVTHRIVSEADALVVVGNSLNASSTHRWGLPLTENLVQIDLDPTSVGRHYPFQVGIVGDARSVLTELADAVEVNSATPAVREHRRARIAELTDAHQAWKRRIFKSEYRTAVPVKPQFCMEVLREELPRDAVVVGGAGNPGIWTHLVEIYEPRTYMKPVGFGNMGFALGAAIGARLARPDRCVVCVIGDGSLGMCVTEIETAVREEAPVVILVMNNLAYGNIKQEQLTHFGPRYIGVDFTDIRFVELARGLGADGERVEKSTDLAAALRRAVDSGKTYLLDVLIDPDENVWTDPF